MRLGRKNVRLLSPWGPDFLFSWNCWICVTFSVALTYQTIIFILDRGPKWVVFFFFFFLNRLTCTEDQNVCTTSVLFPQIKYLRHKIMTSSIIYHIFGTARGPSGMLLSPSEMSCLKSSGKLILFRLSRLLWEKKIFDSH